MIQASDGNGIDSSHGTCGTFRATRLVRRRPSRCHVPFPAPCPLFPSLHCLLSGDVDAIIRSKVDPSCAMFGALFQESTVSFRSLVVAFFSLASFNFSLPARPGFTVGDDGCCCLLLSSFHSAPVRHSRRIGFVTPVTFPMRRLCFDLAARTRAGGWLLL